MVVMNEDAEDAYAGKIDVVEPGGHKERSWLDL